MEFSFQRKRKSVDHDTSFGFTEKPDTAAWAGRDCARHRYFFQRPVATVAAIARGQSVMQP